MFRNKCFYAYENEMTIIVYLFHDMKDHKQSTQLQTATNESKHKFALPSTLFSQTFAL